MLHLVIASEKGKNKLGFPNCQFLEYNFKSRFFDDDDSIELQGKKIK